MNKKIKIMLYSMIIIGVVMTTSMYFYKVIAQYNGRKLFEKVKDNDRLYVYETYHKALNAAMYVEDLKDTSALIEYYKKIEKGLDTTSINFEIQTMPIGMHIPVYVYSYLNRGSKIVELIDFNKKCWGYIRGYVYKPTTHIYPPSDSLIKAEEAFLAKYWQSKDAKLLNRIGKKISSYGWYCDQ